MSFNPNRIKAYAQRKNMRTAKEEYDQIKWDCVDDIFERGGNRASFGARHFYLCLARVFGVFTAKNIASIFVRVRESINKPVKMNRGRTAAETWILTGPGARSFLAWCFLFGIAVGLQAQSVQACDFYSAFMVQLQHRIKKLTTKMIASGEYPDIEEELLVITQWGPLAAQFFACEMSKMLIYIRAGMKHSSVYRRGYWNHATEALNECLEGKRVDDAVEVESDTAHDDLDYDSGTDNSGND
jgi:hypothetical protein